MTSRRFLTAMMLASGLAVAGPVLALGPEDTQAPLSAAPETPNQPGADDSTADAQRPTTRPEAPNPQVVAFVNSQFPAADADGDGVLTQAEFLPWMAHLKESQMEQAGQARDESAATNYASVAFARADVDRNDMVTPTELTHFLMG